ncbi:MAG TPA: hypothetical protein VGK67_00485 [Myxococcales bacterium]|jgi:hypothetical protein
MTRSSFLAVAVSVSAALLCPALALAGTAPPPGSCGSLQGEVVPVTALDLGAVSIKCANCLSVRLSWQAAPQLDYDGVEGYYGVEADWGDSLRYMPFSFWDRRSLTYDWSIDWQDHRDGLTGKTWNFQVGAFRDNASADGPKSTASVYVPGPLAAPANPTGTRTKSGVKLTWSAPSGRAGSQGGPSVSIDRYVVTRLDETPDGLEEKTVGEPTTAEFTDTVQNSKGIPYYIYPLDKFGIGTGAYAYVPEEETPSTSPNALGCSAGPGAGTSSAKLALLLGLAAAGLALRRR